MNKKYSRSYNSLLKISILFFLTFFVKTNYSQNVGVGTTTPTHSFHVVRSPGNPNPDPLRVEGLRNSLTDTSFLVVDNQGVVKYFTLNQLRGTVFSNLDSVVIANMVLNSDTLFSSVSFSDSLRSFIYHNSDTLFSNRAWLDSLTSLIRDSIDSVVDSLVVTSSDSLFLYENGKRISVFLPDLDSTNELIQSFFLVGDSLAIQDNGRTHYLNIRSVIQSFQTLTTISATDSTLNYTDENGVTTVINIKGMVDSLETQTFITFTDSSLTYFSENGSSTFINIGRMVDSNQTITTLVDNGDSTFTYTNERGVTTTINYKTTGTVTTLVDNGDSTFTYTNELGATTTVNFKQTGVTTTLTDNNDGTFTYVNEAGTPVTFNAKDTVITTLVDNGDSTFTYTNELGATTTVNFKQTGVTTTLTDNNDGTFTYVNEAGTPVTFNAKDTVITTLVDNGDSTFTYTNELGATTTVNFKQTGVTTTLTDNNDGTFTYVNEAGASVTFNAKDTVITTLVDNGDSTFTYTNELGATTTVNFKQTGVTTTLTDNNDGTFTYVNEAGTPVTFNAKDTVITTLVDNGDSTFTYTNELGATTTVNFKQTGVTTTLTDNNDGTFTYVNEAGTPVTFNAKDTVITTLVDNGDSTFTYTNELGATTTVDYKSKGVVTTLADNNDGTFTYTNENGVGVTFDTKDTNTTKFGQIGDSVYYVDGFGDTSKVYVNNDTVITTLTDNGNGTFTYINEAGASVTFNAKDTVITTLVDNGDSTFTYTNELGATTTVDYKSKGVVTTLADNNDGTFTYTNENGVGVTFDTKDTNTTKFGQIGDSVYYVDGFGDTSKVFVNNDTVITTLTDNGNGTFTYVNEAGASVTFNAKDTVITTLVDNGDSTFTYTNELGATTTVDYKSKGVVTTLADNNDGTFTYTNENGVGVTFDTKDTNTTKFGQIGDSVYYVDGFGDTSKVYVNNDTVITTLTDNGNGTFTYINEAGASVTFNAKDTVITTLVLDTDTLIYTDENGIETKLFLADLDTTNEKLDTAYFKNDSLFLVEGGDTSIVEVPLTDSSEWTDQGDYILARRAALSGDTVVVKDNGYFGVGTANPLRKMHLDATSNITLTALAIENKDTTDNNGNVISFRTSTSGTGASVFQEMAGFQVKYPEHTHGTRASDFSIFARDLSSSPGFAFLTLKGNNNVGIGTQSPLKRLHVMANNDSLRFDNLAGNGNALFIDNLGNVFKDTAVIKDSLEWSDHGDYIFARRADANGNSVVVSDNGRIGIGTTTPNNWINIESTSGRNQGITIKNNSTTSTDEAAILLQRRNSFSSLYHREDFTGFYTNAPQGFKLFTNRLITFGNLEKMRIEPNGFVGINNTNPQNRLHLSPSSGQDPLRIDGLRGYQTNDTAVLITNPSDGVVRYRSIETIGTIDDVEHLRDDTLSVTQGSNIYKVDLANTMAEIYDVSGGYALSGSFTVIPFGTNGIVDNNYTAANDRITVAKTGRYKITYRVSVEMVGGNNRSESEFQLTRNNVVLPGTYAVGIHRNNITGTATTSVVKVVNLTAGDVIRVEGRKSTGIGELETKSNGSSLLIERL